jgi:hypothetical protein
VPAWSASMRRSFSNNGASSIGRRGDRESAWGADLPAHRAADGKTPLAEGLRNTSPGRACGGSRGCGTVHAHGARPAIARAPRRAAGQAGTPVGSVGGPVGGSSVFPFLAGGGARARRARAMRRAAPTGAQARSAAAKRAQSWRRTAPGARSPPCIDIEVGFPNGSPSSRTSGATASSRLLPSRYRTLRYRASRSVP